MFVDALKEVKGLIFENPQLNPEKEVPKIAEENKVDADILTMFYNNFSSLKYELDLAPELKPEDLEENKKDAWLQPEVDIVMLYMDERKKYEEPQAEVDGEMRGGVLASFSHLGVLLDKTWKGVRFKYYDVKKNLKLMEANASNVDTSDSTVVQEVKRGRGRPKKHLKVVESVRETKPTQGEDKATVIENSKVENSNVDNSLMEEIKKAQLKNKQIEESEIVEQSYAPEVIAKPANELSKKSTEEKSLFDLFTEINRNLTFISIHSDEDNDAEAQLYDLIKTIHGFIYMAAQNLDNALKFKDSQQRMDEVEEQKEHFKNVAHENREDFLNMKEKARDKSEKMKNDILQYSRLSDMQKLENLDLLTRKMLNFTKQVESLDTNEDFSELEKRRFIDKNGVLQFMK